MQKKLLVILTILSLGGFLIWHKNTALKPDYGSCAGVALAIKKDLPKSAFNKSLQSARIIWKPDKTGPYFPLSLYDSIDIQLTGEVTQNDILKIMNTFFKAADISLYTDFGSTTNPSWGFEDGLYKLLAYNSTMDSISIACIQLDRASLRSFDDMQDIKKSKGNTWNANTIVEILDYTDHVYGLNILSRESAGGFEEWWGLTHDNWKLLVSGQDTPPCPVFEKNGVGKGIKCLKCKNNPSINVYDLPNSCPDYVETTTL